MSKNVALANSEYKNWLSFLLFSVSDSKVTGCLRYGEKLDPKSMALQPEMITRIINCGLACSAW